ncbi:MAG TPA: aldose 1-epimerase family protein [Stackebrandtia sp.]|jgi:aldose 1-epimerase|uniref:aldose 1-epimerase family protein n=1 Tax=Stackebrandtia sp. TaxID=2023065 RepID=UPI002D5051A2|nr:aldose 1-epimerase family protein [Stackebrandtia sp.]HZE40152.1 aldose 1-epimerase family protein [Stackebrandtia sp.]
MSLTGSQFTIAAGRYRATVTESGAGLRELTHGGRPLILSYDADVPAPAALGQLLIPWPNRVDHGRYTFNGVDHRLDINEPEHDCAIHGLVRWMTWSAAEVLPERVRLTLRLMGSPGYPYRLDLEAEYALEADSGLTVRVTARNPGPRAAPYAHGAHPYITVGQPIDTCTVHIPAASYLPVNERMIPPGPPEPVEGTEYDLRAERVLGDQRIDRAFTDLIRDDDGRARVRLIGDARATAFWLDDTQPWLEIYTADNVPPTLTRQGLGVEPMTSPPNAFASGLDLVHLAPGEEITGSWGITAEGV